MSLPHQILDHARVSPRQYFVHAPHRRVETIREAARRHRAERAVGVDLHGIGVGVSVAVGVRIGVAVGIGIGIGVAVGIGVCVALLCRISGAAFFVPAGGKGEGEGGREGERREGGMREGTGGRVRGGKGG
jgi:hypothetical protein